MLEIKEHKAYELLEDKYNRVVLDYVILQVEETEDKDLHKTAVLKAFDIINRRYEDSDFSIYTDPEKMQKTSVSTDEFLKLPAEGYDEDKKKKHRAFSAEDPIPYWYAFLEPPYGNSYLTADFIEFNKVLFEDENSLEVYRWNDDFSDYFDAGKEWWGTGLWTVYDTSNKTVTVIGASSTD